MPSPQDIQELLDHGHLTPVLMTLQRTWGDWRGEQNSNEPHLFTEDPDGLTLSRCGVDIHMLRDGRDLLRRAHGSVWDFRSSETQPIYYDFLDIAAPFPLKFFLRQPHDSVIASAADLSKATEGVTAGRATLIVPVNDTRFHLDAEYGTVLAVSSPEITVEAVEVSFSEQWAAPYWKGDYQEAEEEVLAEPAATVDLPEYPPGPRNLRILCPDYALATSGTEWTVGQSRRLELEFILDDAPLPHLATTRRGFLDAQSVVQNTWHYVFRADGWQAYLRASRPYRDEDILTGYFLMHEPGSGDYVTDVVITGIRRYNVGLVIDASLDNTTLPELNETIDWNVLVNDGVLWVSEFPLPAIRGYDLTTGELIHRLFAPTHNIVWLIDGPLATGSDGTWALPSLKRVDSHPPTFPDGWLPFREIHDNLYLLYNDEGRQAVATLNPLRIAELERNGIDEGYRLGNRIYLRSDLQSITMDAELRVVETTDHVRPFGVGCGAYVAFTDADSGTTTFVDKESGDEVTTLSLGTSHRLEPVHGDPELIVAVGYTRGQRSVVEKLAVWTTEKGWATRDLERS